MAGGILNNFLFAILAYICIVAVWGTSYISNDNSCIYASDLAADMGFRTGDRILMMDDYRPENFGMLQADLARRKVQKVTVLRDGDTLDLFMDRSRIGEVLNSPGMFDLAVPFIIDSVASYSVNRGCGLVHRQRQHALCPGFKAIPRGGRRKKRAHLGAKRPGHPWNEYAGGHFRKAGCLHGSPRGCQQGIFGARSNP